MVVRCPSIVDSKQIVRVQTRVAFSFSNPPSSTTAVAFLLQHQGLKMAELYDPVKWGLVARRLQCLPMLSVDVDDDNNGVPYVAVYSTEVVPDETTEDRLARWRSQVEAMELLAMVWLVDSEAWRQLLTDKAPVSIPNCDSKNGEVTPVYRLYLPAAASDEFVQILNVLFTPIQDEERSADFRLAKASILAQETRESVLTQYEKSQLSVAVELVPSRENDGARSVILHWFETASLSSLRCNLAGVNYSDPNYLSRASLDAIHDQVQRGIPLGRTLMGLIRAETFLTRRLTNQLFTDLLGKFGASSLDIRHLNVRREIVEAFFSKLTEPSGEYAANASEVIGLRSLKPDIFEFGASLAERRCGLLWLVYGLFSQDARHSIQYFQHSLYTRGPDADDFRWLSDLLRAHGAPRPELFIFDVFDEYADQEGPTQDHWISVPSGYPIRVQHGDDWRDHTLVLEDRVMRFRVLRDDPTWNFVDILVPGYGRCWVERSDSVRIETQPLAKWTFHEHSIRSLDLGLFYVNEAEQSSVCELLSLIGQPVETLRLTRWISREEVVPVGLGVDMLAAIVRSCPKLQKLSLGNVPVANADVLVDLYEHNSCQITTLDLPHGAFVDRTSVFLFLYALADPTLKISRTLATLHIDLTGYAADGKEDDETLVLATLAMLETNQFLRLVEIHLPRCHYVGFGSQFQALRETLIAREKAPLQLRAKCALLSVVDQMPGRLEQAVLGSVFDFAAECETREVTTSAPSGYTF